jgi:phosphinothricin acetyltransferase
MVDGLVIRDARVDDAAACAAIYAPYVIDTAITFEEDAPDAAEIAGRMERAQRTHVWLVAEAGTGVIGYAYASPFRDRAAYRWACEVSVYVAPDAQRSGVGRALYGHLLPRLAARGYRTAVAGMTLPNDPSVALHRAFGFEPSANYCRIGWKLGAWHDVAEMQCDLAEPGATDPPTEPR